MTRPGLTSERSVALFLLGVIAFNPPLLSVFNVDAFIFGIPVLYVYLFVLWAALVFLVALIAGGREVPGVEVRPGDDAAMAAEDD